MVIGGRYLRLTVPGVDVELFDYRHEMLMVLNLNTLFTQRFKIRKSLDRRISIPLLDKRKTLHEGLKQRILLWFYHVSEYRLDTTKHHLHPYNHDTPDESQILC